MRFTVAATIAMHSRDGRNYGVGRGDDFRRTLSSRNQAGRKRAEQTVMMQGNKRKVITSDRIFITDLDVGRMFVLIPRYQKRHAIFAFPPTGPMLTMWRQQGVSIEFKKGSGHRQSGGLRLPGLRRFATTGVDSSSKGPNVLRAPRPAHKNTSRSPRRWLAKLKGTPIAPKGEVPDGIPVSSTITVSFIPFPVPKNFPPEHGGQVQERTSPRKAKQVTQHRSHENPGEGHRGRRIRRARRNISRPKSPPTPRLGASPARRESCGQGGRIDRRRTRAAVRRPGRPARSILAASWLKPA